jgi:methyl-accepting chemotaxis protein
MTAADTRKRTKANGEKANREKRQEQLKQADFAGQIAAISKSQAVVQFEMDGTIITANDNFLDAVGYTLQEIQGHHHSMFVEPADRNTAEYKEFWAKLNRGEYWTGEYKRLGKDNKEVWIQGSYNPILDLKGKPFKVVKYATDVTAQKLKLADLEGQIAAISKSQAVVQFEMDGTIITANDNFLNAMGYTLQEIQGHHHSMFVELAYRQSDEYKEFWAKLNRGEYWAGEYKRLGKGNKEVWIQGSYNPILDLNGNPFKVVKYATEITDQVEARMANRRLSKVFTDAADAITIEDLNGIVVDANRAAASDYGWSREELIGQPIKVFVPKDKYVQADALLRDCKADKASPTLSDICDPSETRRDDSLINCVISFAASLERSANFRTSSATTANPKPCSPARAASIAAFSANMLVWLAISLITWMIS